LLEIKMNSRLNGKLNNDGFTLIELMTVVVLIAVLLSLAAPSFTSFRQNSEVRTVANDFLSAINLAKSEAIRSGSTTYITPNSDDDWTKGWKIYIDRDFTDSYNSTTDTLIISSQPLPSSVSVQNTATAAFWDSSKSNRYVSFSGNGYPRRSGGAGFNGGQVVFKNDGASRTVVLSVTGRARVCKTGSTNCSSSANQ
jgi:type IV fimbrial biogenesis protein FimT